VAVVKHCSRGFDLGPADKDSSLLLEAGASGVALVGPGRTAIISRSNHKPSDREVAAFLGTVDFVFIEGGSAERDLPKVEILRRGVSENLRTRGRDLRAVVADFPVSASCPTFHLDETKALVEMLEKLKPAGHGTRRR
jgi:molybdopterin-guanine dinucleotide biosynthesis protein MobB